MDVRVIDHPLAAVRLSTLRSVAETGVDYISLGTLIDDGRKSVTTFPWVFLFPAGILVSVVLCANLIGDGLRDAVDPGSSSLRRRRGKE